MSKQEQFDPKAAGIIAHSRVEVLESATWPDTRILIFARGIRINLSVMEGQESPWLRIHLSPDPFSVVELTATSARLQFESIWLVIPAHDLKALFAKAEAVQAGCTRDLLE